MLYPDTHVLPSGCSPMAGICSSIRARQGHTSGLSVFLKSQKKPPTLCQESQLAPVENQGHQKMEVAPLNGRDEGKFPGVQAEAPAEGFCFSARISPDCSHSPGSPFDMNLVQHLTPVIG